ncbi:hypothetical protein BT63DRAFT_457989 [Microthyrium microscopicum]|uniref:Uncharacterized protein n=1 Tax=Microthyrium microscopicum TaxID=703497 RepID=A0A6A6U542_9PEZI|nr:hypothetical protein BT63DRAFT_457989 [Microthyrium microscopicum]
MSWYEIVRTARKYPKVAPPAPMCADCDACSKTLSDDGWFLAPDLTSTDLDDLEQPGTAITNVSGTPTAIIQDPSAIASAQPLEEVDSPPDYEELVHQPPPSYTRIQRPSEPRLPEGAGAFITRAADCGQRVIYAPNLNNFKGGWVHDRGFRGVPGKEHGYRVIDWRWARRYGTWMMIIDKRKSPGMECKRLDTNGYPLKYHIHYYNRQSNRWSHAGKAFQKHEDIPGFWIRLLPETDRYWRSKLRSESGIAPMTYNNQYTESRDYSWAAALTFPSLW